MRLLKINDYIVDIDDNTAIGIDVENLDLTQPSKRFVNSSNAFTIPNTINNLKAIGYIGGLTNADQTIYDNFSVQYFLNNEIIIDGAYVVIQEISDRIKLQVIRKPTIWDGMKSLSWNSFISEYFDYLVAFHNIPPGSSPVTKTFNKWVTMWLDVSDGALRLYPAYTNEADYLGLDYLTPRSNTFQLDTDTSQFLNGGHFWSDAVTLFKFIEYKYNVDFDILGNHEDNPFDKIEFINCIWNVRNFYSVGNAGNWYINKVLHNYLMQEEVSENTSGDLYGLMFSILNTFGVIIENYDTDKYRLRDISYNIDNKTPIDIGLKLTETVQTQSPKQPRITPSIKGYGQESIIKYSDYADGINSVNTRKIVACNNKNIQFRKTIISIDNFVPAEKDGLLNYGVSSSFEQYKIATWEEVDDSYTWDYLRDIVGEDRVYYSETIAKTDYKKVTLIDLSDKWGILDTALNNPVSILQKCWLTPTQYSKINNWTLYYIPELAGSYYINNIKGYNPEKSKNPVTLELIRINNKTPQ